MSRHLGLIIGVNQYQDSSFQQLQFAENDARALAQWLVNTRGGKWSPPDVQLVQGQHATRELAESLLTQICIHKAEPGDVILLYFAGHAFVDELTGEGYLALFNSRYQDTSTSINLLSFAQQIMARSPATHVLCIFDCFQNGRLWQTRRASPYDSKPLFGPSLLTQQPPNRLFLCSCRGNELAREAGEHNLGLMAHSTIVGLCGPASDRATGTITLSGLHSYLFNTLGEQQRPQLFGQQLTPLILVGELPSPTPTRSFAGPSSEQLANTPMANSPAFNQNAYSRQPSGGVLLKQTMFPQTATTQTQPSFMSGNTTSTIEMQQQSQHLIDQAQQFFQAQNYEQAFSLVEQVLSVAPTDTAALTLKGQLLAVAGRFPEAGMVIDQLLQINPNNAMAWSMRAVALTNMGNHQDALSAIERSLELDAQNPETYALKNTITANIAFVQSQANIPAQHKFISTNGKRSGAAAFALGLGLHLLGLFLGFAGFAVLILLHNAPAPLALSLISISLTVMCVNAARGAFRYGFIHLVLAILLSLIASGILGLTYKMGMTTMMAQLKLHPSLLIPLLFLVLWLASVIVLPFILAFGGLIGGLISRAGRRA